MSSILTALKKLEQEAAETSQASLTPGPAKPHRHQKRNIFAAGLVILVLCGLTAVGTAIVARKSSNHHGATAVLITENPAVSVASPEKSVPEGRVSGGAVQKHEKSAETGSGPEIPSLQTALTDYSEKQPQKTFKKTHDVGQDGINKHRAADARHSQPSLRENPIPDLAPDLPPDTVNASPRPSPASSSTEVLITPEISTRRSVEALPPDETSMNPAPIPDEKPVKPAPVEIITDPGIDLQAISWSANPDKRMAIVNGKICREKDRIGKYVIVSINANDVVVSSESATGRLVFEIR